MLLQLAAKKVKQLAFTFSGSNDKAITVLETKRGRAAKKKTKEKLYSNVLVQFVEPKGKKRLKTLRLNNCDQGLFHFRTCAYDAVFEDHRGKPSVFNGFFEIFCLSYPLFISSVAVLWK